MKQQSKKKSIGDKMKSTHTYQRQEEILLEWADAWEKDSNFTHGLIRKAIRERDIGAALRYSDQLTALTEKRFQALENIIHRVCDPSRIMKDRDSIEENSVEPEDAVVQEIMPAQPEAILAPISYDQESLPQKVVRYYKQGQDTRTIADMCQISDHKVIKLLVTAGIYRSETYDRIKSLRSDGKSEAEISEILKIKLRTLDKYTPYKKGAYLSESPTENALRIRKCRENRNDFKGKE